VNLGQIGNLREIPPRHGYEMRTRCKPVGEGVCNAPDGVTPRAPRVFMICFSDRYLLAKRRAQADGASSMA
jgi:hypothetical protein